MGLFLVWKDIAMPDRLCQVPHNRHHVSIATVTIKGDPFYGFVCIEPFHLDVIPVDYSLR